MRNVGKVLKIFDEKDNEEPQKSYRFYISQQRLASSSIPAN
jgi:hypothetical protein